MGKGAKATKLCKSPPGRPRAREALYRAARSASNARLREVWVKRRMLAAPPQHRVAKKRRRRAA
jgi:hypothetical protein